METYAFKEKFSENLKKFSRSLLALRLMESLGTFCGPQNISGAPEQNQGCSILLNNWSRRILVLFFIPQCWYWIFSFVTDSQDGRKGNICSTYIHPYTDISLLMRTSLYAHKKNTTSSVFRASNPSSEISVCKFSFQAFNLWDFF